ncbi:hypothetical protein DICVIV_03829 [Dictyocaulus viviparus]|uniref:Uncharacterized protein n=1 Tax=Dictyocaulus viviparus TaxID=29172 RepID=A0A0D8XZD6_DICVI|nr:hypothetical protein DICVIV_03829 [Dictyocaulus viviparus]
MNGNWLDDGYKKASDAKSNKRDSDSAQGKAGDRSDNSGRGRRIQNQGARSYNAGGNSGKQVGRNDKNVYISIIDFLRVNEQLPMVVFVFSRKRCDENAQSLTSVDLTTEMEKSKIRSFFKQCISRLKGSDKHLPQVQIMMDLCLRGFAVHHSGILPILKEVVELLFQQGYVKMAGRAGRRGLDTTGTVIVLCKQPKLLEAGQLKTIMMGKAAPLVSQFRVTYSMLLNLLRVEHLRVEDMLQRSFVENAALREAPAKKSSLEKAEQELLTLPKLHCLVCGEEGSSMSALRQYHDKLVRFFEERVSLWSKLTESIKNQRLIIDPLFEMISRA